jgi:hypothetical protein
VCEELPAESLDQGITRSLANVGFPGRRIGMKPGAHQAGTRVEQLSPDLAQRLERLSCNSRHLRPGLHHRREELSVDRSGIGFRLPEQPRRLVDQLVVVADQQQLLLDTEGERRLGAEVVLPKAWGRLAKHHAGFPSVSQGVTRVTIGKPGRLKMGSGLVGEELRDEPGAGQGSRVRIWS